MRTIGRRLLRLGVVWVLFVFMALPCLAATAECKLTVKLEDDRKAPINGLTVYICKVADWKGADYVPAEGFENSGISVAGIVNDPSAVNAKALHRFVKEQHRHSLSAVSASGVARFSSLEPGIWLVYCGDKEAYVFNPYIVFLPYATEGELHNEAITTPKTEVNTPNDTSVYVVKKWDDKNDAAKKRPNEITVELKQNGTVIDTAVLSEGNGWAHTFTALPDSGQYTVTEKAVEKYSAKYSGDAENGFIITNTYIGGKLPQTGQLWWPIAILSVAGVAFVLLGIIELGAGKNGKKSK